MKESIQSEEVNSSRRGQQCKAKVADFNDAIFPKLERSVFLVNSVVDLEAVATKHGDVVRRVLLVECNFRVVVRNDLRIGVSS